MAELADAHASGACGSNPVEVQILLGAHSKNIKVVPQCGIKSKLQIKSKTYGKKI